MKIKDVDAIQLPPYTIPSWSHGFQGGESHGYPVWFSLFTLRKFASR